LVDVLDLFLKVVNFKQKISVEDGTEFDFSVEGSVDDVWKIFGVDNDLLDSVERSKMRIEELAFNSSSRVRRGPQFNGIRGDVQVLYAS
jgi:hypothetical protein